VIRVSKNKPKETIEYVIRLQDKERQLLDSITTAYTLGNAGKILTPVVAGLSDISFCVTLIIIYEALTGKVTGILTQNIETVDDLVNAWINYRQSPTYVEEYEERATSVTGGLVNVWEQIWFAIVGGPARTFQQNEGSGGGGGF
jgi:hypothetical protein